MAYPSTVQIEKALRNALGDKLVIVKGARTRGRSWNQAPKGLAAHIFHHTAAPSATGSKGHPSLEWCLNANGNMPFCNALVDRDGTYYVLSLGSCWHSGFGGPWPSRGFSKPAGNLSSIAFWGVEIDDPGKGKTITDAQIKSAAKAAAAIGDLCKWDDYAFVTHGDWTDAGPYLMDKRGKQESPLAQTKGRKIDTLRKYYSGNFWRNEVKRYRKQRVVLAKSIDAIDPESLTIGNSGNDCLRVNDALCGAFNVMMRDKQRWSQKSAELLARWQKTGTLESLGKRYGFEVLR